MVFNVNASLESQKGSNLHFVDKMQRNSILTNAMNTAFNWKEWNSVLFSPRYFSLCILMMFVCDLMEFYFDY